MKLDPEYQAYVAALAAAHDLPRVQAAELDAIERRARNEIEALDPSFAETHLAPVIATVARLRAELPDETTLIDFCGAPWTIATYMIAGRGTPDQAPARLFAYRHEEAFERLVHLLAEMSADYLIRQLQALYDQDFPDIRVRQDDPYVQTREELYKLCLRLLTATARHCDLRDCVLVDELKADIRLCSRQLSEEYFGVFWTD